MALDWDSRELLWQWKVPKSGIYMTLLPERDRLVVSAGGFIHCLDQETGRQRWHNPLTGFGVAALATLHRHSPHGDVASAAAQQAASTAAMTAIMGK